MEDIERIKKRIKDRVSTQERLESDIRTIIEKIFEEKQKSMGLEGVTLELSFPEDAPIIEKYVYGEAFPFEKPPRIMLEVVVIDATLKEIKEIVCEELVHVKHPELKHGTPELEEKIWECVAFD